MADNLAVIRKVIEEHRKIRENIRLTGEAVNDMEALSSVLRTYSSLSQSSIRDLVDTQKKLQQAMSFLIEGLQNHFNFEEKALPPLFGELLMKALIFDHRQVKNKIAVAKSMVFDTRLEGLDQKDLLARKSAMQEAVGAVCRIVEEHAGREETILNMMKAALEDEETGKDGR